MSARRNLTSGRCDPAATVQKRCPAHMQIRWQELPMRAAGDLLHRLREGWGLYSERLGIGDGGTTRRKDREAGYDNGAPPGWWSTRNACQGWSKQQAIDS
jgi:hypothetical protein